MKKTIKFFAIATIATTLTFVFLSCKDKVDPLVPATNTITDIVVGNASFSTLKEAVVKAGLGDTLKGTGPFTVFAPDNAAFTSAGFGYPTGFVANTAALTLKNILFYHTIPSKILSTAVPAGPNAKVITANGDSVFVTKDSRGVFVNGMQVAQADIAADNGVIHRLSRALIYPSGNIVVTAQGATGVLDSLVKAIVKVNNTSVANGGDPSLIATLSSATVTVFAPSNEAFTSLLQALSLTDINNIPVATLNGVLKYHVKLGRAFSSDIVNTSAFQMFAGGNTTLNLTNGANGGPTITGNGNAGNKSNIILTNIMTRNGLVHVIDRVLLP
jgi:uncharacterized surface protein with fasciclin (FAS1) repeats